MDNNASVHKGQRGKRQRAVSDNAVEAVVEFPRAAPDTASNKKFWKLRNRRIAKAPPVELTSKDLVPVKVIFADQKYPSAIPTQEKIAEMFRVFARHASIFDDSVRTAGFFWKMFSAPDTMVWEVPGRAVYYITEIIPGHMAFVHLIVYNKDAMRQYGLVRDLIRTVMDHPMLQLKRVNAFIPASNHKAIWFARTIGFRREACLRQWTMRNGELINMIGLGLLRKELEDG